MGSPVAKTNISSMRNEVGCVYYGLQSFYTPEIWDFDLYKVYGKPLFKLLQNKKIIRKVGSNADIK